ncbi:MAG: hypothetical protein ABJO42_04735, partial [Ekhidna sp.]
MRYRPISRPKANQPARHDQNQCLNFSCMVSTKRLTFRAIKNAKLLNYKAQDPVASSSSALDEARYRETNISCQ